MSECYICNEYDAKVVSYTEIFPRVDYDHTIVGYLCSSCNNYLDESIGFLYQKAKEKYFRPHHIKSIILQLKKRDEFVPELPE